MKHITVKCDEPGCGWSEMTDLDTILNYVKAPCPKCGKGEIINDEELAVIAVMAGLVRLGLGEIVEPGTRDGAVKIDTKALIRDARPAREGAEVDDA